MSDDYQKCQTIYYNLLDCRENKDIPSTAFIREFFETSICDQYNDFSQFRNEYEHKLNQTDKNRLNRVLTFKETHEDEKIALQTCLHYNRWHQRQLINSLSYPNWFYYHTIDRAVKIFAILGGIGTGYAGMKVAAYSFRLIAENKKK